jgi:hypothetical protein
VTRPRLLVDAVVELHVRFNDSWSSGFEVAAVLDDGYSIRRTEDGTLLPGATGEDDIRPARTRSLWR